jgi:hypothetical protein
MVKANRAKSNAAEVEPVVATDASGATTYLVTDTAPPRVAGKRVQAGDSITLTEDQARGELLAMHIRPPAADAPASNDA